MEEYIRELGEAIVKNLKQLISIEEIYDRSVDSPEDMTDYTQSDWEAYFAERDILISGNSLMKHFNRLTEERGNMGISDLEIEVSQKMEPIHEKLIDATRRHLVSYLSLTNDRVRLMEEKLKEYKKRFGDIEEENH